MNAGLVSTAPPPPPAGPQGSTAPGASAAPPKAAGEGFSAHLAKAVAIKSPPKAPDSNSAAPQADKTQTEAKIERPSADSKPDREVAKSEPASQKDDPQVQSATDASAQPQAMVLDQTQAQTPATPSQDQPANASKATADVQAVSGAGFGSKVQALQTQVAQQPVGTELTNLAAPQGETAPSAQLSAAQTLPTDLAPSPALEQLVSEMTAATGEAQPFSAEAPAAKAAAPKAETPKKELTKADAAKADLAKSDIAQATSNLDALDQTAIAQTKAESLSSLGDEKHPGAPGPKAADTASGPTKSESNSNASKTAKTDTAGQSVLGAGASVVTFAQPGKSGGESTPGQGDSANGDQSASKLASTNEALTAGNAPSPETPQGLMAAAIHVAPQTLQTAAVVMKAGPQTVASLASQIVSKAEAGATRFDLELHPLDLGRVDVRLEVGAGGQISAAMSFDTPQAAAEMRARSADLQKALENAGFNLSGGLSFDVAGDRGQGGSRNTGGEPSLAQRTRDLETATNAASDVADAAMSTLMGAYGARPSRGVDIRI